MNERALSPAPPQPVPDPSADLLREAKAARAMFPPTEPQKFAVRTHAAKVIAQYEQLEDPSPEATLAIVKLMRVLEKNTAALEVLRRRRPVIKGFSREILFYEMELNFLCGNDTQGELLLAQLQQGGALRPSWERALARLRKKRTAVTLNGELKRLHATMAGLDEPLLERDLPLARQVLGTSNRALDVLLFTRDRIRRLRDAAPDAAYPYDLGIFDRYHAAQVVFTCGFSWSGSGAVSCFLAQHQDVILPFGMSELTYVQGKTRKGINAFFTPGPVPFATMKKMLAKFLVNSIAYVSSGTREASLLVHCCRVENGRLAVLGALFDDFHRLMLSPQALQSHDTRKKIVATLLHRVFSVRGGKVALMNNVLMARYLDVAPFMEKARFIVVQRDARDQYLARKMEMRDARGAVFSVDQFLEIQNEARDRFAPIRALGLPHLLFIKFEDFIRNEEVRSQVLRFTGLEPGRLVPNLAKFDPSVSVRNIGIHKDHLAADDVQRIETQLGVYLPDVPLQSPVAAD